VTKCTRPLETRREPSDLVSRDSKGIDYSLKNFLRIRPGGAQNLGALRRSVAVALENDLKTTYLNKRPVDFVEIVVALLKSYAVTSESVRPPS
jgi:hypothetical protein